MNLLRSPSSTNISTYSNSNACTSPTTTIVDDNSTITEDSNDDEHQEDLTRHYYFHPHMDISRPQFTDYSSETEEEENPDAGNIDESSILPSSLEADTRERERRLRDFQGGSLPEFPNFFTGFTKVQLLDAHFGDLLSFCDDDGLAVYYLHINSDEALDIEIVTNKAVDMSIARMGCCVLTSTGRFVHTHRSDYGARDVGISISTQPEFLLFVLEDKLIQQQPLYFHRYPSLNNPLG